MNYIWNYAFDYFMRKHWNNEYRSVPVFLREMDDDMLGNYRHDQLGCNNIVLANNQGLSEKQMLGVLLHEMCHHVVYEEFGMDVEAHGFEWISEMKRVGFEDPDCFSDGTDFFSEEEYKEIIRMLRGEIQDFEWTDSLSLMFKMDKEYVDLVLTDPPYIISKPSGFKSVKNGVERFAVSTEHGEWDKAENFSLEDLRDSVREYYRVLKKHGTAIIFCDLWKITDVKRIMEEAGFKQIRLIEWIKTNPVPLNSSRNYLTNSREVALLGVKVSKPTFNSSYDNGIYQMPICHEKGRFHPTQKPLMLMQQLIEKHSNPGDVVLDTFAGAATTLLAAKNLQRGFIGCELDEEFFDKAEERLFGRD
jgi:site-specific DNA-methyltransferase (adenine-specific)